MKVHIGKYRKKGSRKEKVKISNTDLWNLDHTLALVILPALKKFKKNMNGAPYVRNRDVPFGLRIFDEDLQKFNETGTTDEKYFERWEYVLDEMIFAFEAIVDDNWESQFHKDDFFDRHGFEQYDKRIRNGLILFGKYYRGLWI